MFRGLHALCVLVQETRIAKLLVSLKSRLGPYMAGEAEAFTEVQVRRHAPFYLDAPLYLDAARVSAARPVLAPAQLCIARRKIPQRGWLGLHADPAHSSFVYCSLQQFGCVDSGGIALFLLLLRAHRVSTQSSSQQPALAV
jgi:hypothetical protein